jgi:hypothetical protein
LANSGILVGADVTAGILTKEQYARYLEAGLTFGSGDDEGFFAAPANPRSLEDKSKQN